MDLDRRSESGGAPGLPTPMTKATKAKKANSLQVTSTEPAALTVSDNRAERELPQRSSRRKSSARSTREPSAAERESSGTTRRRRRGATASKAQSKTATQNRRGGGGGGGGGNKKKKSNNDAADEAVVALALRRPPPTALEKIQSIQPAAAAAGDEEDDLEQRDYSAAVAWPIEHLSIRNRSYFYRNVRLFGRERMRFQSVTLNKRSGQFEARFFNVLPFESVKEAIRAKFDPKFVEAPYDESKLRALEMRLDPTQTERAARRAVQRAVAARDAPPKKKYGMSDEKIDPSTHLQTHFTVTIVSAKFAGLDVFERLALVHHALLGVLEVDQGQSIDAPTSWRGYGTVGPAVRALPQFRFMQEEVVVMALTPHQWKPTKYAHDPAEHRYGRSRLEPSEVDAKAVVVGAPGRFERLMKMENKCRAPSRAPGSGGGGGVNGLSLSRSKKKKKKKEGKKGKGRRQNRGDGGGGDDDDDDDVGGFLDNFGVAIYAAMKEEHERGKTRRAEAEQLQDKHTSSSMVNRLLHLINDTSKVRKVKKRPKPPEILWEADRYALKATTTTTTTTTTTKAATDEGQRQLSLPAILDGTATGEPERGKSRDSDGEASSLNERGLSNGSGSLVVDATKRTGRATTKAKPASSSKPDSAFGASAKAADTPEEQMRDVVDVLLVAARSLQRLYRQRLRRRFLRWWFRRHAAATLLARYYRGYCGRVYVFSYHSIRSKATLQIQCTWRGYSSRQWTAVFRATRLAAVRTLQPFVSNYLLQKRLAFAAKNRHSAISMQRVIRGHVGRCRGLRLRARRYFLQVVVVAVCRIQGLFHGHKDRVFVKDIVRRQRRHRMRTHRGVLALQRTVRGAWSRRRVAELREKVAAVQRIQALFHGFKARARARALRFEQKRHRDASTIARVVRGFLGRELVRELRAFLYHTTVRVPAAITMQKVYRSYAVRERARKAIIEWNAAQKMVTFWRFCKAMIVFHQRWLEHLELQRFHLAALFQKIVRGFLARRYTRTLRLMQRGEKIKAAFPLQNAWRKFAARRTVERQRIVAEDHWSRKCILESNEDLDHYTTKIDRLWKRIRNAERARKVAQQKASELSYARRSNETRIPQIELELQRLDEDEVENGWADALEEEWDQRTNGSDMMAEEILQLKIRIKKCDDAIEADTLEVEELEAEREECCVEVLEEYQLMRNHEIDRLETQMRRDYAKAVSRQRKVWRIKDGARSKTVERMAADARRRAEEARPKPSVPAPVFLSMAHSKMATHEKAQKEKEHAIAVQRDRQRYVQAKLAGERNPVIPQTFDRVVAASREVLMEFDYASTLGRRSKDPGGDTSGMCLECGRMHCVCKAPEDQVRLF